MRRYLPCSATLFVLAAVALADAGQREAIDFEPAGPFLFEPGTSHPTYMDAFDVRPIVKSPDGKLDVTVIGPEESYRAWVTISAAFPGSGRQVWPIQRNVAVLWRPDSHAFALTDNRYANASYALVCSTVSNCRAESPASEEEPQPGPAMIDLTPVVRNTFEQRADRYYQAGGFDTPLFYAKVLRWIGDDELLIGVSARTVGRVRVPGQGQREWDFAYIINVPNRRVVREVDKHELLSEYKIKTLY